MKSPRPQAPPADPYYEDVMPIQREQQDAELTRWQLESDEQIEMFKRSLKGEVFDNEKKNWVVNTDATLMNDQGVEVISAELRDRVNKISTLSNLNAEQIYNIVQRFEINLHCSYVHVPEAEKTEGLIQETPLSRVGEYRPADKNAFF